jgi:hypothetical protein
MSQIDGSTSPAQERQRLDRICAVLVAAFDAHPETRDADRCATSLDNQRGVVVDDYDDTGELWTARRVAAHYAVGVRFICARADDLGAIRLGAGQRPRLGFDPAVVRERWASVHALPPEARARRRRPTTKLHAVRTVELLEYGGDDSCCSAQAARARRGPR